MDSSAAYKSIRFISVISILGISLTARSQVHKNDTIAQIGLPEVVVSALRLPFRESSVPYSISLMNARANTRGLSLAESLAGLPGLEVNARYNFSVGDRITNRGFGARTQFGVRGIRIIFDDMPVTFADGQSNLEMIDLQNLSFIEFLRGPGSSLYGNASGGILILHSKEITNDRFLVSASSTIGSDGLFRWNGLMEGKIGSLKVSGNYTGFQYKGFRDHANAEYRRAFIKVVTNISVRDNLQFEAGIVKFNSMNPGSLTKQEYEVDPGKANPSSISNAAGQNGNQSQIAGTWKHRTDTNSSFKLTLYGVHRSVVNPIIGKIVVLPQNSGGISATFNSVAQLWKKPLEWSAGAEVAMRLNNRENYINNNGLRDSIIIDQNEQVVGTGVFLQALYPATVDLKIHSSLRYDLSYFGVQNRLDATGNENDSGNRTMKAMNPSIGIIYRILESIRFFANLSTSFETPTSTELVNRPEGAGGFNPELNPSRALGYEVGFRGFINKSVTYDLAAYFIRTKDELIPFQVPEVPGQDYFRNAGSTLRRGGEMTFRFRPVSILDLSTSLTITDAFYKKFVIKGTDYHGNKIPGISRIHGVAELKLHHPQGPYFSLLMQSFGRMYVDDANSATANQHTLFDIGLGHDGIRFGRNKVKTIILSGGISNLFNIKYVSSVSVNAASNRYYEPGPGRNYYLNARFDFGIR